MPSTAPAWDSTDAHVSGGDWQSTDEHLGSDKATSSPLSDQLAGIGRSLRNQAKGTFDMLTSLVDPHMGQKIGDAVIDAQVEQWHKAKSEYAQGNYGNALRRGLAAVTPFVGPLIEHTAEKATSGQPGAIAEAATDVAAPYLLIKAAEHAPEVGQAISDTVGGAVNAAKGALSKVVEIGKRPGLKETATGTAQVLGGTAGVFSGYPPAMAGGGAAILRGLENISKGRALAASEAAPAAEFLDRLNMSPEEFRALPADGKAQIQELVTQMASPRGTPPPPADFKPSVGTPELAEQIAREKAMPGRTPSQMVADELAARRVPAPRPTTQRVPLWQQQQAGPAAPPSEAAPTPSMPVQLPSGRIPGRPNLVGQDPGFIYDEHGQPLMRRGTEPPGEAPTAVPEAPIAKNPPPEAYESTYQARRARVLGEHLFDKGITVEQAMRIKPESLTDSEWETLLGKDPDTGEQYHAPSDVTLKQAVVNLQHLNRMARGNLIGATVTLKNGKAGIVKAMQPDGGFEYEELP